MNKFFVLFCIDAKTMMEWMSQPDTGKRDEQNKEAMEAWHAWFEGHKNMIADGGTPLGKTLRVNAHGVEHVSNDLNYYIIVEGETQEAVAELFKEHPHLKIPNSYIEIMSTKGPTA